MSNEKITATQIDTAFIDAQQETWKAAAEVAQETANAYMTDLETRKAALAQQAAGYRAELDQLHAQRESLAATINDLTSRGQVDEVLPLDAELETVCKSISLMERKISILGMAKLKGDPELYQAAKAAHDAAEAERTPYRASIATLQQIVKAEIERLERIQTELGYAMNRDPGQYAANTFTKVDRHYRDLDRLEREAADKAAAERTAAEQERGSYRYSLR